MSINPILTLIESTPEHQTEGPQPLFREAPEGSPFPVEALGPLLAGAAKAIQAKVQCPLALGSSSVLAAATVGVQAHVDVKLPTGEIKPCSGFFLAIGSSGERKTAGDALAMQPIKKHEAALWEDYENQKLFYKNEKDAWDAERQVILRAKANKMNFAERKSALHELGPPPEHPLMPLMLCEEPTLAALQKSLTIGLSSQGIFSNEGGLFLGGFGLREDAKLHTISGLSQMWDGGSSKRSRGGDGFAFLQGKRVSLHLMVQPEIASGFLSDRLIQSQGFLSRFLVMYPQSTMGTRLWQEPLIEHDIALRHYEERLRNILEAPWPMQEGRRNELQPRVIKFSPKAERLWIAFYNAIEVQLCENGPLREIAGLANKAAELVGRLATVIGYFENPSTGELSEEDVGRGIELVQFYLKEAIRLYDMGQVDPVLQTANKLLNWLNTKWDEDYVSLTDILQCGPNIARDRSRAERLVGILEKHRWLVRCEQPVMIRGKRRNGAFRIVKEV